MQARTAEMDKLTSEHEVQVKSLQDRAKEQIDRLLKDKKEAAGNHEVQLAQAMRDQQERKEQLLQANALNEEMNEAIISSTDKIGSSFESLDKALLDALERIKATQESALQEAQQMKEEMRQLKEHQVTLKGEHISEMGEMQKKFKAQEEADEQRHIKALEQEYAKGKSEGAASERAQNEEKRKDHDKRMNDHMQETNNAHLQKVQVCARFSRKRSQNGISVSVSICLLPRPLLLSLQELEKQQTNFQQKIENLQAELAREINKCRQIQQERENEKRQYDERAEQDKVAKTDMRDKLTSAVDELKKENAGLKSEVFDNLTALPPVSFAAPSFAQLILLTMLMICPRAPAQEIKEGHAGARKNGQGSRKCQDRCRKGSQRGEFASSEPDSPSNPRPLLLLALYPCMMTLR